MFSSMLTEEFVTNNVKRYYERRRGIKYQDSNLFAQPLETGYLIIYYTTLYQNNLDDLA